jgi:hypothetical protein
MKRLITSCLWGMIFVMLGFTQTQEGRGTWYETESKGLSASHSNLPFGTRVRITNLQNDRQVIVTIDNRIADTPNRIIDISRAAADNLGMNPRGTTPVRLEVLARRQNGTSEPAVEVVTVPSPEPTVEQLASSPTLGIEVKSDPANPGMVNQTIITFNGMPGYSQNEGSASLSPAPSLTSSGGRQVTMMPEPVATAQEVPVPIPVQPEPILRSPEPILRSPEPVVVAPQPMVMQPAIIAPVVVPPVVVPPVLAEPILAPPVLAEPILSPPILAPPVVAEPVLSPPVVAEPVLSPPVVAAPVTAGPVTAGPVMSPPLTSPMVIAEPMVTAPVTSEPLSVNPSYSAPVYTESAPTGSINPESLWVPSLRDSNPQAVVQVTPRMPDPGSGRIYRLQVGAFSKELNAREAVFRLREVGFDPAYELYGGYCRVVLTGIRAADVETIIRRVGAAGFMQVFIREEP